MSTDLLRFTRGAGAVVAAGMLLFLFMVTVMTAVAQQEVLARMAKEEMQIGYSSAFALLEDIDERRAEIPSLRKQEQEIASRLPKLQADLQDSQSRFDADWARFEPLARRIGRLSGCEITFEQTMTIQSRLAVWNDSKECAASQSIPASLARQLDALVSAPQNLDKDAQEMFAAEGAYVRATRQFDAVRERLKAAGTLSDEEQKARRSFSEMNVLRGLWMLGGGFLVEFPPPLLQILLAFVSGAFGALLVTVVLVVYPNSKLNLSAGARPASRIFLGGMIAMCVYIVLLGGTAVLGASVGITAAGTNYMAFCAIGILAGMFSDRVAYWLSDRADAFFKREPDARAAARDE